MKSDLYVCTSPQVVALREAAEAAARAHCSDLQSDLSHARHEAEGMTVRAGQLLQGLATLAAERTTLQRQLAAAEAALWEARAEGGTLRDRLTTTQVYNRIHLLINQVQEECTDCVTPSVSYHEDVHFIIFSLTKDQTIINSN